MIKTLKFTNSNEYNQIWQPLINIIPGIKQSIKSLYQKLTDNHYGPRLSKNKSLYYLCVKERPAILIKIKNINNFDRFIEVTIEDLPKVNFFYNGIKQIIIDNIDDFNNLINDWYNQLLNAPAPKYAYQTYYRKGRLYTVEEVLSKVDLNVTKKDNYMVDFDGDLINMGSNRYKTFLISGTVCHHCGLKATYFAKERHGSKNQKFVDKWHFNLYGINKDGKEIIFTKDHIIPKSKGGSDNLDNFQTLCYKCNSEKGNGDLTYR